MGRQLGSEELSRFRRINVVGVSGSGKTTVGRELARVLDLPFHEMDQIFWKPGWEETPDDEYFAKLERVTSQESWVLDGNYSRTTSLKWKRAQLVVWIDLSYLRTLGQAVGRVLRRTTFDRRELWPGTGNRESFRQAFFSRKSMILWTARCHGPVRRRYLAAMEDPRFAHLHFVRLRSRREVSEFLDGLGSTTSRSP